MDHRERYRSLLNARPALAQNLPGGIDVITDPAGIERVESAMAQRFASKGLPRDWARAGVFYEDPYIMVLRDAVIFPDGQPGLYHRAIGRHDGPTGVAILGKYRGDVILVRHFRHPTRAWHLEIPRGAIAGDENATQMAHVEISEEIGGTISSMTQMGVIHGASAFMRHRVVLVYAEFTAIGTPALGEGVGDIVPIPPARLEQLIRDSEITDSFTVAAAYHARLRGLL
ncbi:MAG: NUDIX hydrolase [Stellaceae bacterium]